MVEIKFCGLTREEDAAQAGALGAAYVGAIFAGGPRELTTERALLVLGSAGLAVRRVGVFGLDFRSRISEVAGTVALDVVQLHADPTPADVRETRAWFSGAVWAAVRVDGTGIPDQAAGLFECADAVLLDAKVPGRLGGAGVPLPWGSIARAIERIRGSGRLVLAGGLLAENVAEAVAALAPDIVDVSSGVESAPGIKDHTRMRDFQRAAKRSSG